MIEPVKINSMLWFDSIDTSCFLLAKTDLLDSVKNGRSQAPMRGTAELQHHVNIPNTLISLGLGFGISETFLFDVFKFQCSKM
jgi:hypothetical protein